MTESLLIQVSEDPCSMMTGFGMKRNSTMVTVGSLGAAVRVDGDVGLPEVGLGVAGEPLQPTNNSKLTVRQHNTDSVFMALLL